MEEKIQKLKELIKEISPIVWTLNGEGRVIDVLFDEKKQEVIIYTDVS